MGAVSHWRSLLARSVDWLFELGGDVEAFGQHEGIMYHIHHILEAYPKAAECAVDEVRRMLVAFVAAQMEEVLLFLESARHPPVRLGSRRWWGGRHPLGR